MLDEATKEDESPSIDEMIEMRKCINCIHSNIYQSRIFCFYSPGPNRPEVWSENHCSGFEPTSEQIMNQRRSTTVTSQAPNELRGTAS
jgi:hypothetical protein